MVLFINTSFNVKGNTEVFLSTSEIALGAKLNAFLQHLQTRTLTRKFRLVNWAMTNVPPSVVTVDGPAQQKLTSRQDEIFISL